MIRQKKQFPNLSQPYFKVGFSIAITGTVFSVYPVESLARTFRPFLKNVPFHKLEKSFSNIIGEHAGDDSFDLKKIALVEANDLNCEIDASKNVEICAKKNQEKIEVYVNDKNKVNLAKILVDCKKGIVTGSRRKGVSSEINVWITQSISKFCSFEVTEEQTSSESDFNLNKVALVQPSNLNCETDPSKDIEICARRNKEKVELYVNDRNSVNLAKMQLDCKAGIVTGSRRKGVSVEINKWVTQSISKFCFTPENSDSRNEPSLAYQAPDQTNLSAELICDDQDFALNDRTYNICTAFDNDENYLLRFVSSKNNKELLFQVSGDCLNTDLKNVYYNNRYISKKDSQLIAANTVPGIVDEFCKTTITSNYIRLISSESKSYYNIALSKYSIGDYIGALSEFDKAISLSPYYADAYNQRGKLKTYIGDQMGALNDYNIAIEIDSSNSKYYKNRASIRNNFGNYKGVVLDYNRALSLSPNNIDVLFKRAVAQIKLFNYEQAIKDNNRVIEIDSEYSGAYRNRAIALLNLGHLDRACKDFSQSILLSDQKTLDMFSNFKAKGIDLCGKSSSGEATNFDYLPYSDSFKTTSQDNCDSKSFAIIEGRKRCF